MSSIQVISEVAGSNPGRWLPFFVRRKTPNLEKQVSIPVPHAYQACALPFERLPLFAQQQTTKNKHKKHK